MVLGIVIVAVILCAVEMRRRANAPRLVSSGDGPFMVLAHVFKGPDAGLHAQSLAAELRSEHGVSAYLYPLAGVSGSAASQRRKQRSSGVSELIGDAKTVQFWTLEDLDTAAGVAVLVGDAKTLEEAQQIRNRIRRIAPKAFVGLRGAPTDLRRAIMTTNPTVQMGSKAR
jgi:hypothetical protein